MMPLSQEELNKLAGELLPQISIPVTETDQLKIARNVAQTVIVMMGKKVSLDKEHEDGKKEKVDTKGN
jgi:hypothetical protein